MRFSAVEKFLPFAPVASELERARLLLCYEHTANSVTCNSLVRGATNTTGELMN